MKKYLLMLLFVFCLVSPRDSVNSQIGAVWEQRYDGTADTTDIPGYMEVDALGNVYITGFSVGTGADYDIVTIKYNSAGTMQWQQRYNGTANSTDYAEAIAVDDSGNVFVAGSSIGTGTEYDIILIKYNPIGVQQWVQRYNGPAGNRDYSNDVILDKQGNIYLIGSSFGIGTDYDFVTIKYSPSGLQQWLQRYNGTGNSTDTPFSVDIDSSGNIYMAGYSGGLGTHYDFTTIKYNSSGVEQWVQRYNGTGNSTDVAAQLEIVGEDNIYVSGYTSGNGSGFDCLTIKYNSAGVQQWLQVYNGPANGNDFGRHMACDDSGNVYVSGSSTGNSTGDDYLTIKYNSAGVQQWLQRYNGAGNATDNINSIALDNSGNVYVTGFCVNNTNNDFVTIKYNSSGTQQWMQTYNGPANNRDEAYAIILDHTENVIITGSSYNVTNSDYVTIKYSQTIGIQNIGSQLPENFSLGQNYPNPFNPVTNIEFSLPKGSFTKIIVYDITGREVAELVNQNLNAGTYKVDFDASHLSSGTYFYRLTAGDFSTVKKMILVK